MSLHLNTARGYMLSPGWTNASCVCEAARPCSYSLGPAGGGRARGGAGLGYGNTPLYLSATQTCRLRQYNVPLPGVSVLILEEVTLAPRLGGTARSETALPPRAFTVLHRVAAPPPASGLAAGRPQRSGPQPGDGAACRLGEPPISAALGANRLREPTGFTRYPLSGALSNEKTPWHHRPCFLAVMSNVT